MLPGMPASGRHVDEGGAERWVGASRSRWPRGVWAGGRLSARRRKWPATVLLGGNGKQSPGVADWKSVVLALRRSQGRSNQKAKEDLEGLKTSPLNHESKNWGLKITLFPAAQFLPWSNICFFIWLMTCSWLANGRYLEIYAMYTIAMLLSPFRAWAREIRRLINQSGSCLAVNVWRHFDLTA